MIFSNMIGLQCMYRALLFSSLCALQAYDDREFIVIYMNYSFFLSSLSRVRHSSSRVSQDSLYLGYFDKNINQ